MQAYISNCLLGSKKRSNNFQFKSSLTSKYIILENQNSLITPLAVCASLLKERQPKGPDEERDSHWWENGCRPAMNRGTVHEKASRYSRNVWIYPGNCDWWHCQRNHKVQRADFSPVPTCAYLVSFSSWLLLHHRWRPLWRSSIHCLHHFWVIFL